MLERILSGEKPATVMPAGATDTQTHMFLPNYEAQPGGPPLPSGCPGPTEYRRVMNWLGVERVVITQGNAHQRDNANLLACLEEMGSIARGVVAIGPHTDAEALKRFHEAGVRGARIMDLPGGAVGLETLEDMEKTVQPFEWRLAVQFDGSQILDHFDRLAALRCNWILDHHGKFFEGVEPGDKNFDALRRLIDGGNCWFKLAGCYESSLAGGPHYEDIGRVASAIAEHAPDRVIWGTNWPHNLIRETKDYPNDARLLDTVLGWIPKRHHQAILVDSPAFLFDF
ncbi:amidohydrolase family protein [Hoeflea sp. CAU 1731]